MGTNELKQQLHEYIEIADEEVLQLIYGILQADKNKADWWYNLDPVLKESINKAIQQLDNGEGRPHEVVMKEIREKYLKG